MGVNSSIHTQVATDATVSLTLGAEQSRKRTTNRALTILGDSNDSLLSSNTEEIMFEDCCRIVVETGGYEHASLNLNLRKYLFNN